MKTIRFGLLGAGNIANFFCQTAANVPEVEVAAVYSLEEDRSRQIAQRYGIPKVHTTLEALLEDDIDAVYVGTHHAAHFANARAALMHGKHVLCEKPFVLRYSQARELVELARERGLMLMEAMWNRFHPATEQVNRWVEEGCIGSINTVVMASGVRTDPESMYGRIYNPKIGGGALLDFGCYAINNMIDLMGSDYATVHTLPQLGPTGVDIHDTMVFGYPDGRQGVVMCSCSTSLSGGSFIYGTKGYIRRQGWNRAELVRPGEETVVFSEPFPEGTTGYEYEQRHFVRCIQEGLAESPRMPHEHTLAIMRAIDAGFAAMAGCEGFVAAEDPA